MLTQLMAQGINPGSSWRGVADRHHGGAVFAARFGSVDMGNGAFAPGGYGARSTCRRQGGGHFAAAPFLPGDARR